MMGSETVRRLYYGIGAAAVIVVVVVIAVAVASSSSSRSEGGKRKDEEGRNETDVRVKEHAEDFITLRHATICNL